MPTKILWGFVVLAALTTSCESRSNSSADVRTTRDARDVDALADAPSSGDASTGHEISLDIHKAFPSAQGLGAGAISGGRGGKVFYVTSLDNSLEGSFDETKGIHEGTFRYAMEHADAGYIVFRVAGVVSIAGGNGDDHIFNSTRSGNKTVLGGTAPFPGIVFYGNQFRIHNTEGNWVIRGITSLGGTDLPSRERGAFTSTDNDKVIVSDCSFGWASDDAMGCDNANRHIYQRNLIVESEPANNKGGLMQTQTQEASEGSLSAHDNGFIHASHRFFNYRGLDNQPVESVNQSVYNYSSRLDGLKFQIHINDINNYYRPGPRSSTSPTKKWNADAEGSPVWQDEPRIYSAGNIIEGIFDDPSADNSSLYVQHISANGYISGDALPSRFFVNTMHPAGLDIFVKSASAAWEYNINRKNIGARFYMDEEGVRKKYIHAFIDAYFADAINKKDDAFRNDQSKFTRPVVEDAKPAYVDSDHDGMADEWERMHGLDPTEDDKEAIKSVWEIDGLKVVNNAGYTNIEIFGDYVHGGFVVLRDQVADR